MAKQNADGAFVGSSLECGLDCLALIGIHAAVHGHQAVVARKPFGGQNRLQPILRGTVFGEDDDPIVRPLVVRAEVSFEPAGSIRRLCCRLGPWP